MHRYIFLIFLFLNTSCNSITYKLWQSKSYEDNFKHFLINPNHGYIIFLTTKFHYVFNDNSNTISTNK